MAGDHTPTLKSELSYLRLESLEALGNGGFEVEETLFFPSESVNLLDKNQTGVFIWCTLVAVPPVVILVAFLAVMSGIFLFSCVWRLRRFKNMRGKQVCGIFTC